MTTRSYRGSELLLYKVACNVTIAVLATAGAALGFDPVSLKAPDSRIELSVLGTYRGGWYSKRTPTYPVYDKWTQRVFYGSDDRSRVEVIDISNPASPTLFSTINTGPPTRLAMSSEGILAVSGSNQVKFYNAGGTLLGSAASTGAGDLEFTPDGTKLVVNQSGSLGVIESERRQFRQLPRWKLLAATSIRRLARLASVCSILSDQRCWLLMCDCPFPLSRSRNNSIRRRSP